MPSVDQTFDRLRRFPIEQVYSDVIEHMHRVAYSRGLNSMGFRHEDVAAYILERGYTVEEIVEHYRQKIDF